jgi:hypothetical protein
MRAKELIKLELALSQVFSGLDESNKVDKPTLNLSRSYTTWMRAKELIHHRRSPRFMKNKKR